MKLYKYIIHNDINQHQQQHEHRSIGENYYYKLLLYSITVLLLLSTGEGEQTQQVTAVCDMVNQEFWLPDNMGFPILD